MLPASLVQTLTQLSYLIAAAPLAARMPFGELQATLIKSLEATGDTTVPVRRGPRHNLDASP